jgi:hypothetical protein
MEENRQQELAPTKPPKSWTHPVTQSVDPQPEKLYTERDMEIADVVRAPAVGNHTAWLEGPAGAGKTGLVVARLRHLLESGVSAASILVLVPQRTLTAPYDDALQSPDLSPAGRVDVLTLDGLARRTLELFWPLVAVKAGFAHPERPPVFLSIETAQYFMARLIEPLLAQGYFDAVTIQKARLISQVLDNLNKAALTGTPHTEVAARLKAAWGGESSQHLVYDQAQECAGLFRDYCLAENLLDFSLRIETFREYIWSEPVSHYYLRGRYRHLLVDNLEEDTPATHDLLREWLPWCDSALLIYDRDAGYRLFLGADPHSAAALKEQCRQQFALEESLVAPPPVRALATQVGQSLRREVGPVRGDMRQALEFKDCRFYPQMLDWVADEIFELVERRECAPGDIVVLAPFLSDALRFSLLNRLERLNIPARSHRPSRALRDEPAVRCLLTLAKLAHPQWEMFPPAFDVAQALSLSIEGLDLVRAQLLTGITYRVGSEGPTCSSFARIKADVQERITYLLGGRFDELRRWLEDYKAGDVVPLDHFFSRLFGELLSRVGYGFHKDLDAGRMAANLIESARKFREVAAGSAIGEDPDELGKEYVRMVEEGVLAAQYVRSWRVEEDAVLLAPAHTYLMSNRPVDYQFWLNVGSTGWWERIYQPLTHPYVLSRRWSPGRVWTDEDEVEAERATLYRLVLGLARRCRKKIYLGISELSEEGYEQKGPLLQAIQAALRRIAKEEAEG